eukprot:c45953_g1_i1.p1 GENE.c45953_g1_i1~~c45953_g1_i1.p1  ORF type:complete len:732 (+),score=76.34 c45953_g1_i1:23-2197(+)
MLWVVGVVLLACACRAEEPAPDPVPELTGDPEEVSPLSILSEFEDSDFILSNKTFIVEYINVTGNINATLIPVSVCPHNCFSRGQCIPIPSPSPSASFVPKGMGAPDPNMTRMDPAEYARYLAAHSQPSASVSTSPAPSPAVLPEGASPSVTPLPGQIGGPVTDDMVPGAPEGGVGGPALSYQRRRIPGICVCDYGFFGPSCEFEYCYPMLQCMGRGLCTNTSDPYNPDDDPPLYCRCEDGWKGRNCEHQEKRCGVLGGEHNGTFSDCSENGACRDGVCVCFDGWNGDFCQSRTCPLDCSGHGKCNTTSGMCECDLPYFGRACSLMFCEDACHGHGICDRYTGQCDCDPMFFGPTCGMQLCPNSCSDIGDCDYTNGTCTCPPRWMGEDCSVPECPDNCGGGHTCVDRQCICDPGWMGPSCNTSLCWHKCAGFKHAFCHKLSGNCTCFEGWVGAHCEIDDRCPKYFDDWDGQKYDCSNRGRCVDGACVCDPGWTGHDCSEQFFRCGDGYYCENGGTCNDGRCECLRGFKGFDCSLDATTMCEDDGDCVHGQCAEGLCHCHDKWAGVWCQHFTGLPPFDPDNLNLPSKSPSRTPHPKKATSSPTIASWQPPPSTNFSMVDVLDAGTNGTNATNASQALLSVHHRHHREARSGGEAQKPNEYVHFDVHNGKSAQLKRANEVREESASSLLGVRAEANSGVKSAGARAGILGAALWVMIPVMVFLLAF